MAFTEEVIDSMVRLNQFQAVQAGIRAQQYTSAVPYFAFARSAQIISDLALRKFQSDNISHLQANIPLMLTSNFDVAADLMGKEGASAAAILKKAIQDSYKGLYDAWVTGLWHGVGNVYSSAMEQFLGTGDLLWAYKHLMHRIAVTPKMARHWNTMYRPTRPNVSMAFNLWKRNQIKEADWKTIAKHEGWPDAYIPKLQELFTSYPNPRSAFRALARGAITTNSYEYFIMAQGWPSAWKDVFRKIYAWWPSAFEAFFMWKKGIIDKSERNKYYKGQGYTADMYEKITANFGYVPTLYDLIRIADYQEVDLIWATRIMMERGMRTKDIAKFIKYLKYRPLRDEVRNLTNQLVWRYQYGRITPVAFETELGKLPIGVTEKSLITDYAEMRYEDELITEQMFILKWQFRMGWITEANYLAALISLDIREEKANLIVEQEKAQGYFGYY